MLNTSEERIFFSRSPDAAGLFALLVLLALVNEPFERHSNFTARKRRRPRGTSAFFGRSGAGATLAPERARGCNSIVVWL
jgi:hypothetical protein